MILDLFYHRESHGELHRGDLLDASLSLTEIPKTKMANQKTKWFAADNPYFSERAKRIHPERETKEQEFSYTFNDHGYRSTSFNYNDDNKFKVLSVGCSLVFGTGVPSENRYPAVFCKLLEENKGIKTIDWNIGWPGAGNDYISRMLLICVPILKPDLVLVNFTFLARREYRDANGRLYHYKLGYNPKDMTFKHAYKNLTAISNPYENTSNFYKNYKLIEQLLETHNIRWIFTIEQDAKEEINSVSNLSDLICEKHFLDKYIERDDDCRARDFSHPGSKSHEKFGKEAYGFYQSG